MSVITRKLCEARNANNLLKRKANTKPIRSQVARKRMRKVRIICHDPDMTDESSGEDEPVNSNRAAKKAKLIVKEINLPFLDSQQQPASLQRTSETGTSSQDSSIGDKTCAQKKRGPSNSVFKGVRQRIWGKWAAEIRDPFRRARIWLGTFDSAQAASDAYQKKLLQFQQMAASKKSNNKNNVSSFAIKSQSGGALRHTSPLLVPEMESKIKVDTSAPEINDILNFGCSLEEQLLTSDLGPLEENSLSHTSQEEQFLLSDSVPLVENFLLHSSPSSVLERENSDSQITIKVETSAREVNGILEFGGPLDEQLLASNFGGPLDDQLLASNFGSLDDNFVSAPINGPNFDMWGSDLASLFNDDDFYSLEDDITGFYDFFDFPVSGFGESETSELPDFDFDIDDMEIGWFDDEPSNVPPP